MNEAIEIALIDEAKRNIESRTTSLKGDEQQASTERYTSQKRFQAEIGKLFNSLPTALAHSAELAGPNSYLSVNTPLGSLIVSRDAEGKAHVLRNSCRHRGAKLVEGKGCSKRLVCPYHAWSYSTNGELSNVPGESHCFPNIDKSKNNLISLQCVEKLGFIWLCPKANNQQEAEAQLETHLGDMAGNLAWLKLENLKLFRRTIRIWNGNWKLFAEGGLETYHFTFAHKNTIAPYFCNNTAVIDKVSNHYRVVMPTKALASSEEKDASELTLHDYSHTLFFLLPSSALLMQKEHVDWVSFRPISPNKTEISVATLIPESADIEEEAQRAHWQKNHEITNSTLNEDWELGASIQESMDSDALPYIQYGKNEWALHDLNELLDNYLASE